jgi:probable phosphoglycerate mutase
MIKILLSRHGHVEGITPLRFRSADIALTALGLAQAEALSQRIARDWKPTIIYSSPTQRCIVTATRIAEACPAEHAVLDGLRDFDYGTLTGRTHDDVGVSMPDFFAAWQRTPQWVRFPDGDSLQDVAARTADVLRFVLDRHADATIVLVAHDSSSRVLLLQLLDLPLSAYWRIAQAPCALTEIDIGNGRVRLQRMNETSHLTDLPSQPG